MRGCGFRNNFQWLSSPRNLKTSIHRWRIMKRILNSREILNLALERLFTATNNKPRDLNRRYDDIKTAIAELRFSLTNSPEDNPGEQEWLSRLDNIINGLQQADDIILNFKNHYDIALIRKSLDLYNNVLQEDKLDIRGLSALLAKRIRKASNILNDLLSGSSMVQVYEKPKKVINKVQFSSTETLTPEFLMIELLPWIRSIDELQTTIDHFQNEPHQNIRVLSITQNSPINVALNAGAEAIRIIEEMVVPWRRRHAQKLAEIEERHKHLELEMQRVEIQEKRALIDKTHNESLALYEEARRKKLENEILLENYCRDLAQKIVKETLNINQPKEIEDAVVKVLPAVTTLATSSLDISKTTLSDDKQIH